ncbi:MAG: flavin reductase [Dehalococcoidia bacterium]|nr:flavin reductase [Dehalococcoidia bacterium]
MTKAIRITSEEPEAIFQHRPVVATIVTAHAKGRDNALAIGLHTLISHNPPICGIAVMPQKFTYELIAESKEFGVNFMPFEEVKLVCAVGTSTGRKIDKFQKFNIAKEKSVRTGAPILEKAYAAYECKLIDDTGYGSHRWLVGDIVAVHWLKEVYTPENTLDLNKVNPILFLGRNLYLTASKDTISSIGQIIH